MSGGKVREQASPFPTDLGRKQIPHRRSQKATDHSTNQRVPLQMRTGSKGQEAYFQAAVWVFHLGFLERSPSLLSPPPPASSMKLLSEPTLLALDRKSLTVILHPLGDG